MTPEEKAIKLVDTYLATIVFNIKENINASVIGAAKQCALICVDEILKNTLIIPKVLNYWEEVKQEIQKL